MPRVRLPNGRVLVVPDDITEAELQALVEAEADTSDQGPPSETVMDERGVLDRGVDYLPSAGGAITGFLSRAKGTPVGAVASGLGAATGELVRQGIRLAQGRGEDVPDTFTDALKRAGQIGLLNAGTEVGGRAVIGGLSKIAPRLMRGALGAQTDVRKSFPDVDLDAIAVRERAFVNNPRSVAAIQQRGSDQAATLRNNLRVADIQRGGAPVATHADAVSELRRRVPDARMAARGGRGEELAAVRQGLIDLKRVRTRPLGAEETFVTKQANQKAAADAYRAKVGAEGTYRGEVMEDTAKGLNTALKRALPETADDLQRAQELMALERAMVNASPRTSVLRDAIGAGAGTGAGLLTGAVTGNPGAGLAAGVGTMIANRALTSPGALSRYGIAADRLSQILQGPSARIPDAIVRQMLLQLLSGQTDPR